MILSGCTSKKNIQMENSTSPKNLDIVSKINIAEIDNLGNIYIVDSRNVMTLYNNLFENHYKYANNRNGRITTIDVGNPLRTVLFYDDFDYVRILDNTLTVITELDLKTSYSDVSACGVSNDGNLWIFDAANFKLVKINDSGRELFSTSNVTDYAMSEVQISKIRENNNFVVLCDYNRGFYVFDNLGQYVYHFPARGVRSFQFDGEYLIYYTDTGLKTFSMSLKERTFLPTSVIEMSEDLNYILYSNRFLYGVYKSGLKKVPFSE